MNYTTTDTPRVHFWSLSDYNSGRLLGDWIEIGEHFTHEEVLETIQAKLAYYDEEYGTPEGPREEYLFGDFEGFPSRFYSESMSFGPVLQWIEDTQDMDEDRKEAYELYLDSGNGDTVEKFEQAYRGKYSSEENFAEEEFESIYSIPDHLQYYIDWEAVARDLFMGDYTYEDGHVFRYN